MQTQQVPTPDLAAIKTRRQKAWSLGITALLAAHLFAQVTGVDHVPSLLEQTKALRNPPLAPSIRGEP